MLAGFGAGTYKTFKTVKEADGKTHLLFDLPDSETMVLFNNKLMKLETVMSQKRTSQPTAKICYHEELLGSKADNPRHFKCRRIHNVFFTATRKTAQEPEEGGEEGQGKSLSATFLNSFPFNKLQELQAFCKVIWAVRWTLKGLMPVEPFLVLTSPVTIPSTKSVEITTPPTQ